MIDLDKLEALAKAAGGNSWTADEGIHVWNDDGDSVCACHSNLGHMPEPVMEIDFATFIAAANPSAMTEIIALVRRQEAELVVARSICIERSDALIKANERIAQLEAQLAAQAVTDENTQGMADCMDMVRQELIEAGVIDETIAPMFIANAVVARLAAQAVGVPEPSAEQVAPAPIECWSADEEDFNAQSLGDLLDAHDELTIGSNVYFGEAVHPDISKLVDPDDIIDTMADRAYDIAGEYADGYPSVSAEDKAELATLLDAWINKRARPTFYTVKNVQSRVLTEHDFPADHEFPDDEGGAL